MRVYGRNSPEITEVDLNMSIRAVKDKRPSRSVCMCVCGVVECAWVVLCVASERQRERLRVKLTADRPVQRQRAQANLISDGCLSDDPRTVTLMELRYLSLSCWTLTFRQAQCQFSRISDPTERNKHANTLKKQT